MSFEDAARAAGFDLIGSPLRGGSGLVHRARQQSSDADVAIKVLGPGHDLQRLEREAALLDRLDHPNIANLRDVTDIGDQPALIVDWVDGRPLREALHDGPMGRTRAIGIFEQLALALDAVHAEGIVHRDISPANVLVDDEDRMTVIDFGVSRADDSATVTVEGSMAGTPRYLAPEVIAGAAPTPASDQYSAAIVFHEMLAGTWPFPEGDAIATALHHQLHTAPTPLDEIDPTVPPAIADAVLRSLDKDPANRFGSMSEMLSAFSQAPTRRPKNRKRLFSALLITLVTGAVLAFALLPRLTGGDNDDPERLTVSAWAAGTAESLPCNLLTEAAFETNELPENWFKDGDDLERPLVRVLADGGVDNSGRLQIGEPNSYGIWGEAVQIEPNVQYLLSANIAIEGDIAETAIWLDWVDADFSTFGSSSSFDLAGTANGQVTLVTEPAPARAAWGVPRFYKDNSEGLLFLDELVLAREGASCEDILRG